MKLQIPVDEALHAAVKAAACRERRSVANWCVVNLEMSLPDDLRIQIIEAARDHGSGPTSRPS